MNKIWKFIAIIGIIYVILDGIHFRAITNVYSEEDAHGCVQADTIEYHNWHFENHVNDENTTIYVPNDKQIRVWFAF